MFSVPCRFAINVVAALVPGAAVPLVDAGVAGIRAIAVVSISANGNDGAVG